MLRPAVRDKPIGAVGLPRRKLRRRQLTHQVVNQNRRRRQLLRAAPQPASVLPAAMADRQQHKPNPYLVRRLPPRQVIVTREHSNLTLPPRAT